MAGIPVIAIPLHAEPNAPRFSVHQVLAPNQLPGQAPGGARYALVPSPVIHHGDLVEPVRVARARVGQRERAKGGCVGRLELVLAQH